MIYWKNTFSHFKISQINTKRLVSTLCLVYACITLPAQMSKDYGTELDAALKERVDLLSVRGAAASVVFPDGSIWSSAEGTYGPNELTTDLLYEIGSNTKTMVAATILMLQQEGKLTIDDTLYSILQPLTNVSSDITIRQLLNHTSGLYDYTQHPDFFPFVNANWDAKIEVSRIFNRYMEPAPNAPGSRYAYCNTNYILLGMVIEKLEEKPIQEVLKKRISDPYGLNNTYLAFYDTYTDTHLGTWLSNGAYLADPGRAFLTGAWSAGAVISTPEDLALWAYELYSGAVLADSSFNQMTTTTDIGNGREAGLGMFTDTYKGKKYYGHGGLTLQSSEMQYSLERDFSVVTMVIEQNKSSQASLIQRKLIDIVDRQLQLLSVSEHTLANVRVAIYPNPSHGAITIDIAHPNPVDITLTDMLGTVVYYSANSQKIRLERSGLKDGIYVVTITDPVNGHFTTRRIVMH